MTFSQLARAIEVPWESVDNVENAGLMLVEAVDNSDSTIVRTRARC